MPEIKRLEEHSAEVQELMGFIPRGIIRWGLTVIFVILGGIIAGSYFFAYKEIVAAPLILTTTNPPASLISKSSGRIAQWFVSDGQKIEAGARVAIIENSIPLENLFRLERIVSYFDSSKIEKVLNKMIFPQDIVLGDLQNQYNQFYNNWMNYWDYMNYNFVPQKIELLQLQIEKQKEYYNLSLSQKKMMEQEIKIEKKGVARQQIMLKKGGVSETQFEEASIRISQLERSYTSFLASLKSAEISMLNLKSSLLELQEQHYKNIEQYKLGIGDNLRSLKSLINNWVESYVLASPVSGTVTLTKYWSENHVVTAGERVATVIPDNANVIICRAKISSGDIAKIKIGQTVHIKLSGYPYMEYGMLRGRVQTISLVPEDEKYIVEIGLNEGMISNYREQLKLVQEMDGTAEFITGEMRMIYRFINPLKMIFKRS